MSLTQRVQEWGVPELPNLARLLQYPIALPQLTLMHCNILHNAISLQLKGPNCTTAISEILKKLTIESNGQYYIIGKLDHLFLPFCLLSRNEEKHHTQFRFRVPKTVDLGSQLIPLVSTTPHTLILNPLAKALRTPPPSPANTPHLTNDSLQLLLDTVAHKSGQDTITLLRSITRFKRPNGYYPGVAEVKDLSERQRPHVYTRLQEFLPPKS